MKALITAQFHENGLELLDPHMDIQYENYRETGKLYFQEEELIQKIRDTGADVLIVEVDPVHEEVFQACSLKIVGCCRADPLNVSGEEATKRGIPIFYAPGRNADSAADITLGFMLSLSRNLVFRNTASDFRNAKAISHRKLKSAHISMISQESFILGPENDFLVDIQVFFFLSCNRSRFHKQPSASFWESNTLVSFLSG